MTIKFDFENNNIIQGSPQKISNQLKTQAQNVYNTMVAVFIRSSKMFWENPNATPQQIAEALGTDAKQLFEVHYKLGQFISSINPSDIEEVSSIIGNFTMNEDGTITILPKS
jgi:hypothetical protein